VKSFLLVSMFVARKEQREQVAYLHTVRNKYAVLYFISFMHTFLSSVVFCGGLVFYVLS